MCYARAENIRTDQNVSLLLILSSFNEWMTSHIVLFFVGCSSVTIWSSHVKGVVRNQLTVKRYL